MLKGVGGVVMALPFLESVARATGPAPAPTASPVRVAFLYMANGVNAGAWTPAGTGPAFEFSPTLLPLELWEE